jgi:hypothetical protein
MKTILSLYALALATTTWASDSSEWRHLQEEGQKALEKNNLTNAEDLFIKASEKAEPFGIADERYAKSLRHLGDAALQLHHYANADFAFTRLIRADGARWGTNDLLVAEDLLQLTDVAGSEKQFLRAHESVDAATAIVRVAANKNTSAMGFCDSTRAWLEMKEGHLDLAETDFQEALEIFETRGTAVRYSGSRLQMSHTYFVKPEALVVDTLKSLAACQIKEKKYPQAEDSLHRELGILESDLGKNSPQLAIPLDVLARIYFLEGKLAEAESTTRRALGLLSKADPSQPSVNNARALLGKILAAEGKSDEAATFKAKE